MTSQSDPKDELAEDELKELIEARLMFVDSVDPKGIPFNYERNAEIAASVARDYFKKEIEEADDHWDTILSTQIQKVIDAEARIKELEKEYDAADQETNEQYHRIIKLEAALKEIKTKADVHYGISEDTDFVLDLILGIARSALDQGDSK